MFFFRKQVSHQSKRKREVTTFWFKVFAIIRRIYKRRKKGNKNRDREKVERRERKRETG